MATDLTPADLATLRRLLAAATPGPWRKTKNTLAHVVTDAEEYLCRVCACGSADSSVPMPPDSMRRWNDDAALIAALVNAAPKLIEMAERWLKNEALMGHLSGYLGKNGDDD